MVHSCQHGHVSSGSTKGGISGLAEELLAPEETSKLGSCGTELFFTRPQQRSRSNAFHFMDPEGWVPFSEKPRVQSALGPVHPLTTISSHLLQSQQHLLLMTSLLGAIPWPVRRVTLPANSNNASCLPQ